MIRTIQPKLRATTKKKGTCCSKKCDYFKDEQLPACFIFGALSWDRSKGLKIIRHKKCVES